MRAEHRRVRIECPDGNAITAKITDAETGEQILHVYQVDFHLRAQDVAKAELFVYVPRLDAVAEADIHYSDALDRAHQTIASLEDRIAQLESRQDLPD